MNKAWSFIKRIFLFVFGSLAMLFSVGILTINSYRLYDANFDLSNPDFGNNIWMNIVSLMASVSINILMFSVGRDWLKRSQFLRFIYPDKTKYKRKNDA